MGDKKIFVSIHRHEYEHFLDANGLTSRDCIFIWEHDQIRGMRVKEENVFYGSDHDRVMPKEVLDLYIIKSTPIN